MPIPNYPQIDSNLRWPLQSQTNQSGLMNPFVGPGNSLPISESLRCGNFSLPVGSSATLPSFQTSMSAGPASYVTLDRSTLLISEMVAVPTSSNVLSNNLQVLELNLNNGPAFDLKIVPGNHSWVTDTNLIRPIALNPPWASSLARRGSSIRLSAPSGFYGDFADGDRFRPSLLDPLFDEIAFETLDIWGRRTIFKRIVYRLALLRRSALNLKTLVDRCIKNLERRVSKKPIPKRSKKSYKSHPRVTINLPLMC